MQAKRGFTLVEILIVVVILGILAAIVIPQFTQASTEAKLNSLSSNLQTLRSQIELYKTQHNDVVPLPEDGGATWARMTETTSLAGVASGSKVRSDTNKYGPYLERVPENPFNDLNTVKVVADATAAVADDTVGWILISGTGELRAANSGNIPGDTSTTFNEL
jgi:general secretion pathway protein G